VTRAKISEYSATAGDNTDVNGVNIAEGCPPSGINDAIREVMGALKRFETGSDGDSITVGGNLVVSGSTTANTLSTTVLQSDTISEKTSAAGVTVDGVLLKDSGVVTGAGTVSAPVYSTTGDTNTGIFFPAADTIAFAEGGAEAMRIDSSGNLLVGGTSTTYSVANRVVLAVKGGTAGGLIDLASAGGGKGYLWADDAGKLEIAAVGASTPMSFVTNGAERARITSGGALVVGKTIADYNVVGGALNASGSGGFCTSGSLPFYVNRKVNDGSLVDFNQDDVVEGTISVSGTTVTYGGGHLARWAQLLDGSKDESLKKGTVLSNLDEMCVWSAPTTYWTEEDELPVDEEGNPTVAVGDVKKEAYTADNEQCNKIKVSDVEGDANVAGVFVSWTYDDVHNTNDLFVAMTGDMIIRIAQGVTVARGDLLMSAGDGTAMPQGDDIVRSKTIAKVTSTHVTCTYDDGSYCVPCVLMAC
jgi:hypothetical protein